MEKLRITPNGYVRLSLPSRDWKQHRTIGQIQGDTYVVEKSEKCIMRAFGGSIGFCLKLMKESSFTHVIVRFPSGRQLHSLRQTILDYGHVVHFKDRNLEVQVLIELSDMNKPPKTKVLPNSTKAPLQGDLFEGGCDV